MPLKVGKGYVCTVAVPEESVFHANPTIGTPDAQTTGVGSSTVPPAPPRSSAAVLLITMPTWSSVPPPLAVKLRYGGCGTVLFHAGGRRNGVHAFGPPDGKTVGEIEAVGVFDGVRD